MKILVISQHYKPEPFRISDICESWVKKGHEVTVVTGVPNYPEGIIYEGYQHGQKRKEILEGVRVFRTTTIARRKNIFFRFLNYYSYAISSSLSVLLNRIQPLDGADFDVIYVQATSPIMMAYAALVYKWKKKVPIVLNALDLWPESLLIGGIKKDSIFYRYYHVVSRFIYRNCDCILLPTESYRSYMVEEFAIEEEKLVQIPQYAEEVFEVLPAEEEGDTVRLLFAGNMGSAQGLDVVLEAATLLEKKKTPVIFELVGDGSDLSRLKEKASALGLSSVQFYGRKPIEEMPNYYQRASAFLVTLLDSDGMNRVLPGKVQSYMASGKPILASINGETSRLIQKSHCGLVSPAQDAVAFASIVEQFVELSKEQRQQMGENARLYYETHFAKEIVLAQIEEQLLAMKKN